MVDGSDINRSGTGSSSKSSRSGGKKRIPRSSNATPTASTSSLLVGDEDPTGCTEDMHVLVPINDVVCTPLSALSEAAADTLSGAGGGNIDNMHVRIEMDRFCRTLESVFRTDYSGRVDRANAAPLLGGRWDRAGAAAATAAAAGSVSTPDSAQHKTNGLVLSAAGNQVARIDGKAKQSIVDETVVQRTGRWRRVPWKRGDQKARNERRNTSEGGVAPETEQKQGRWSRNATGRRRSRDREDPARAAEERCLPLLHLVEDLVRDAMFSPISERDVMMSQARRNGVFF